ncbi:MAG TPA: hypothetical protein VEQ59_12350, partial [Polyangiaceae bacterium]|nr:hypothetical protein [Polyangiaceae bacterium]
MRVASACSVWLMIGLAACRPTASPAPKALGNRVAQTRTVSPPPVVVRESVFTGMCDASAVVPLSRSSVLVADDEENTLRAYDADQAGAPTGMLELSQALGLPTKVHKDGRVSSRELDIEAATRLGNSAYFLTSHGRDSRGRLRKERLKFFEVDVSDPAKLRVSGVVYDRLLEDLLSEPRLTGYGLAEASRLPPKAPGG